MKKLSCLSFCGVWLISCGNAGITEGPSNQDFAKYVSVGGSLTAGFADGKLARVGQIRSYPNLLAKQLATVGGGDFAQPLVDTGLEIVGGETNIISPYQGSNNNYGVPGLVIYQTAKAGLGNAAQGGSNAFFSRMVPAGQQTKSYLEIIKEAKPTLVTIELGTDDVLDYLRSGGTKAFTDYTVFHTNFDYFLTSVLTTNAKVVVANVPDLTSVAALNTYPLEVVQQAHVGRELYIRTNNDKVRMAKVTDFFLKSGFEKIGKKDTKGEMIGYSPASPVPHEDLMDETEMETLRQTIVFYNTSIERLAAMKQVPMVDLKAFFSKIKDQPVESNGVKVGGTATGGFYTNDGIFLTSRGNALITNEFIKIMNASFQSQIPLVDVSQVK